MPRPTPRPRALAVTTTSLAVAGAAASGWDAEPTQFQIIALSVAVLLTGWNLVSAQTAPKKRGPVKYMRTA